MRHIALLSLCLILPGCALFHPRPAHAPPEEAAQYRFPVAFPTQERQSVSGVAAAAITLAMEDFLPLWMKPPRDASPREVCVAQRQSYDVMAAPASEGVLLVSFSVRDDACRDLAGPPIADIPTVYAIDTRKWIVLSIQK